MGGSKRMLEEMEAERESKREALLNAPRLIEASNELIQHLRDELEESSETARELRQHVKDAGSWKAKAVDYLVGGLIGALIGLLF